MGAEGAAVASSTTSSLGRALSNLANPSNGADSSPGLGRSPSNTGPSSPAGEAVEGAGPASPPPAVPAANQGELRRETFTVDVTFLNEQVSFPNLWSASDKRFLTNPSFSASSSDRGRAEGAAEILPRSEAAAAA